MNIPRKIGFAGLITKVLSITLLYALMSVSISTVGPLTVCRARGKEKRSVYRQWQEKARERGEKKMLLMCLAQQSVFSDVNTAFSC